jgi:transcriptional regulator with XRE-family HTH domain
MRHESHDYFLNAHTIDRVLEENDLHHADLAFQLGFSRSYWSQLVNGHRRLSPRVRRALRGHPILRHQPVEALWSKQPREAP